MSETDAMVFVVDDDAPMRESLKNLIRSVGLQVELFASAQEFLRSKRPDLASCLVLDVRLPGLSGLDLQKRTGDAGIEIPIVFIAGRGDIPMSVRAMKAGAVEFLTKPFRDLGKPPARNLNVYLATIIREESVTTPSGDARYAVEATRLLGQTLQTDSLHLAQRNFVLRPVVKLGRSGRLMASHLLGVLQPTVVL